MREIKAIIQPFMLENVLVLSPRSTSCLGSTVSQVLGWGQSRAAAEAPVFEAGHAFARKTKLEVVVRDESRRPGRDRARRGRSHRPSRRRQGVRA